MCPSPRGLCKREGTLLSFLSRQHTCAWGPVACVPAPVETWGWAPLVHSAPASARSSDPGVARAGPGCGSSDSAVSPETQLSPPAPKTAEPSMGTAPTAAALEETPDPALRPDPSPRVWPGATVTASEDGSSPS